ncbi:hypothetical protein H0H93_012734 [Arthromyces matolae]|nr:hypothetical protein H0H93_012734 [Arthromyces matolae]
MSPTFIRLKYYVLASLIAAASIHQSSSFAEAAPTPTSLTNELLLWDSLLPGYINSDFLDLTTPMTSSDTDSDFDCSLDQPASDRRCVAPLTLIRRNNDDAAIEAQLEEFERLGTQGKVTFEEQMNILSTQVAILAPQHVASTSEVVKKAWNFYLHFLHSDTFRDLMSGISAKILTSALNSFGLMPPFHQKHHCRITEVVYKYLRTKDIDKCLPLTEQALLISREIVELRDPSPALDELLPVTPEERKAIAEKYLPLFGALLEKRTYQDVSIHLGIPTGKSRSEAIGGISSRYMEWKQHHEQRDAYSTIKLEDDYERELKDAKDGFVKTVLRAYIWLLSQPDQKE